MVPDKNGAMLFTVSVHHGPRYLIVAASGQAGLPELVGACNFAAEVARSRPVRRVMIDLLSVDPDLDDEGRRALGLHVAEQMRGFERVSVVIPSIFRTGLGENIARGAGLNLQIFASLDEASDWLEY